MDEECFVLHGLEPLHRHIVEFYYLLENWVSPRLAVSPTPRVKISYAAEQQVMERIGKLSALPAEWRPTDAEQLANFQKHRANGLGT